MRYSQCQLVAPTGRGISCLEPVVPTRGLTPHSSLGRIMGNRKSICCIDPKWALPVSRKEEGIMPCYGPSPVIANMC